MVRSQRIAFKICCAAKTKKKRELEIFNRVFPNTPLLGIEVGGEIGWDCFNKLELSEGMLLSFCSFSYVKEKYIICSVAWEQSQKSQEISYCTTPMVNCDSIYHLGRKNLWIIYKQHLMNFVLIKWNTAWIFFVCFIFLKIAWTFVFYFACFVWSSWHWRSLSKKLGGFQQGETLRQYTCQFTNVY